MKKIFLYVFLVLMFCDSSFADELFGIKLGDDIKNYKAEIKEGEISLNSKLFNIKPKVPNPDFENYWVFTTLDNKIHTISATIKKKFNSKVLCEVETQFYIDTVDERLKKKYRTHPLSKRHYLYINNNEKLQLDLMLTCVKDKDHFSALIWLNDWIIKDIMNFMQKDLSKEGL